MKKGISLVALVITIIVLIILAGTVILTVMQNGMIDKSKEAVFKTNIKSFIEDYTNTKLEKQLKDKGGFNETTINASFADNNMKEWIPSITDEFIERIYISNGVFLADRTQYTEEEIVWLEELGVGLGIAPVIGSTDLWELDETKTKIVKYLGTIERLVTQITIPNKVKDTETGQIYNIVSIEPDRIQSLFNNSPYSIAISENLELKNSINSYYDIKKLYVGNNVTINTNLILDRLEELYIEDNVRVLGVIKSTSNYDSINTIKKIIIGDNFYCTTDEIQTLSNLKELQQLTIGNDFFNDSEASCLSDLGYNSTSTIKYNITIGDNFYSKGKCLNLMENVKEIQVGNNLKCDENFLCNNLDLDKVTIGDNAILTIDSIGKNSNLKSLNIGKSLTLITPNVAYEVDGFITGLNVNSLLDNVNIGSFKDIGKNALKNCEIIKKVVLEDGGTISGVSAFENCTGIEEIVLGNIDMSALAITHNTFKGCTGIKKVTIGKGAGGNFKTGLFQKMTSIETVIIEDNAIIPMVAFNDCSGINSLTIGQNVTLGTNCFAQCKGLTSLTLPGSTKFGGQAMFVNCTSLTSITLEEGLTELGQALFVGCTGIQSIKLPSTLTTLKNQVFTNCTGITSLELSSNLQTIGNNVFGRCTNLTSITIPSKVTSIGNSVFVNCTNLTSITIESATTSIGLNCFVGCNENLVITAQSQAVKDALIAAGYGDYIGE